MPAGISSLASLSGSSLPAVLFDSAIKGALLLVFAAAATLIVRRASAAIRYQLWFLVMVGLVLIPILSVMLPGWQALPAWADFTSAINPGPPASAHAPTGVPLRLGTAAPRFWSMLPLVWATGVVAMITPTALALLSLRRIRMRASIIRDRRWLRLVDELRGRLGIGRPVTLLRGDAGCIPMTWGLIEATILIPPDAEGWSLERKRVVLLHELAHIQRRDSWTDLAVKLARAMHWFNPLAWFAARRLAAERERACDDIVLSVNSDACGYAEHLLQVAVTLASPRLAAAMAIRMARASTLEGRLLAILDQRRSRGTVTRAAMLGSIAVLLAVLVPLSALRASTHGAEKGANGDAPAVLAEDDVSEQPIEAEADDGTEGNAEAIEEEPAETRSESGAVGGMGVGISAGGLNFPGGYPPAPAPPERTQPETTR